jgi:hypothetical protein
MRTTDLSVIWEYGVWSSGSILYFPFFVESFVIGFAIVEFHQLLFQKKNMLQIFHKLYVPSEVTGPNTFR